MEYVIHAAADDGEDAPEGYLAQVWYKTFLEGKWLSWDRNMSGSHQGMNSEENISGVCKGTKEGNSLVLLYRKSAH